MCVLLKSGTVPYRRCSPVFWLSPVRGDICRNGLWFARSARSNLKNLKSARLAWRGRLNLRSPNLRAPATNAYVPIAGTLPPIFQPIWFTGLNTADSSDIYAALFRVRPLTLPRGRCRRFCSASRMPTICSASFFSFRGSSWTSASPHRSLHRRLFREFITDHPKPLALTVDCRTKA